MCIKHGTLINFLNKCKGSKKYMRENQPNKPLVSVIIPTFKTNCSLEKAIISVVEQSYNNIEIIVVDDNWPDSEYRKMAELIVGKFKKIQYIQHPENKNGSAARNTGFLHSKGEYICFLDDDDFFYKNKIEKQVDFLLNNKFDGCTCFYKKDGREVRFDSKKDYKLEILMNNITPQTSSLMLKRGSIEELKGFNETYNRHQDYEFLLRFLEKYKLGTIPEILYERVNNGVDNIPNGDKLKLIKDKFLEEFNYVIEEERYNAKKIYAKNYMMVIFVYLKNKQITKGIKMFIHMRNIYILPYLIRRCIIGAEALIKKRGNVND
jgi:glycosyltransferase involved in cell wall biosynthesis